MKDLPQKGAAGKSRQNEHKPFIDKSGQEAFVSKKEAGQGFFIQRQAEVSVGAPNSPSEEEAERLSRAYINRMPNEAPLQPGIQRKCENCEQEQLQRQIDQEEEIQEQPLAEQITPIQRQPDTEEEPLETSIQRQAEPAAPELEERESKQPIQPKAEGRPTKASPSVVGKLHASKGGGSPLPKNTRASMETAFGTDFSGVRVHTGADAVQMNRELHAQAFTHGGDIYFNEGKFKPKEKEGRRLLAHELTHVVQQGKAGKRVQRKEAKEKVGPPVDWKIKPLGGGDGAMVAIPKPGFTLDEVVTYLYGTIEAKPELIRVNKVLQKRRTIAGLPLLLMGVKVKLRKEAVDDFDASPKIPLEEKDPSKFLAKKKTFDDKLEVDFLFLVKKLREPHYSESDEEEMINIFEKWAMEPFVLNPSLYPEGGEYLDLLFRKLRSRSIDIGVGTTEKISYYSLIFNRVKRADEIRAIRDVYSRYFIGDEGVKEVKFSKVVGETWEKNFERIGRYLNRIGVPVIVQRLLGGIAGVIQGLVEMIYELAELVVSVGKALGMMIGAILYKITKSAEDKGFTFLKQLPYVGRVFDPQNHREAYEYTMELGDAIGKIFEDPQKFFDGIANAASEAWDEVVKEYNKADPFNQGRIIAKGVFKVGMAVGGFIKSLPQLAKAGIKLGAKGAALLAMTGKILGKAYKVISRTIVALVKHGKKTIKGTWVIFKKTLKNGKTRFRYFIKRTGADKLDEIKPSVAEKCVKCNTCRATDFQKELIKKSEKSVKGKGKQTKKGKVLLGNVPRSIPPGMDSKMRIIARELRQKIGITVNAFKTRNVAVFKVKIKVPGRKPVVKYLRNVNDPGGLHSEAKILKQLEQLEKSIGRKNIKILRVYSERIPCSSCASGLNKYNVIPKNKIHYSVSYQEQVLGSTKAKGLIGAYGLKG